MSATTDERKSIRSILREVALQLLEGDKRIEVEDVVARTEQEHGPELNAAQQRLARAETATIVRTILRELASDDDDQLAIPGLALPSAICVRTPERTYYVRADAATWSELLAGAQERADNVRRAQERLDRYMQTCDRLRPYMEHDPAVTVRIAWDSLQGGAAA